MEKRKVEYSGSSGSFDSAFCSYKYVGTGIDDAEIRKKLAKFNSILFGDDNIHNKVKMLREIFKDFEEENLEIIYSKGTSISEKIVYNNKKLTTYIYSNGQCDYDAIYSSGKITLRNSLACRDRLSILERVNELKQFSDIDLEVTNKDLKKEAKIIIDMYELFYGEFITTVDKNTKIKIHGMIFLLAYFGILAKDKFKFKSLGEGGMPISIEIVKLLDKASYNNNANTHSSLSALNNEQRKKISQLGNLVCAYASRSNASLQEFLILMTKILYTKEFEPYPINGSKQISNHIHCDAQDVKNTMSQVSNIKRILRAK